MWGRSSFPPPSVGYELFPFFKGQAMPLSRFPFLRRSLFPQRRTQPCSAAVRSLIPSSFFFDLFWPSFLSTSTRPCFVPRLSLERLRRLLLIPFTMSFAGMFSRSFLYIRFLLSSGLVASSMIRPCSSFPRRFLILFSAFAASFGATLPYFFELVRFFFFF